MQSLKTSLAAGAAAVALVAFASGAAAQSADEVRQELELLRQQNELLMQRLEELESRVDEQGEVIDEVETARVVPDRDNVTVELSGRINQALLYADNGDQSRLFIADNDNSGSRFGLRGEAELDDITVGSYLEATFEVNSTDEISFDDDGPVGTSPADGDDFLDVRHAEFYVESGTFGTFALGFGNTATEEVSEVDLSGTGIIAESDVDDTAGGLSLSTGQDIDAVFSNLDGGRTSRVFYETPTFDTGVGGISLAAAARQEDRIRYDVAALYGAEFGEIETEAAFGYRETGDLSDVFHGSASVLLPSGLNFTFAGGVEDFDDEAGDVENENFFYGKLGYRVDLLEIGETRVSIDYFNGDDNTGAVNGDQTDAESIGGGVVQVLSPLSMEAYLAARVYDVQLPQAEDPDDFVAVFSGARVRF